ncbi:probable 4-coumarate--CoA ligase 2 [Rhipicephalus sanguineus]|uniref:probable 4-coumarate--CoA ligase 2 n=1 Tax=Rhipicephalus sanguineus TaxID=34632 RepID=UPI0020C4E77A|nr:probable 4-coumarate--CoA ligase 2 [Rhipicephalus sanguineus]
MTGGRSNATLLKGRIENKILYSPYPKLKIPVCSVYTCVKSFLSVAGNRIVAVDYTTSYTRQELLRALERYAAGFQSQGLKMGDHVCVHMRNSVDAFVTVFSLIFAGATTVLAKTSLTHRELLYQMTDGDAKYIVTDPPNADKVRKVCDEMKMPEKARFILGEAPGFTSILGFALMDPKQFREVPVPDPRNTIAGISYTSGTTGLPKGVEITHFSFIANIVLSKDITASDETDVFLAWNPITHMSGFLFTMLGICIGSTCVIVSPALTFNQFVDVCNKYQVSSVFSFASRLQNLVNEMLRTNIKLEQVRKLSVGGSLVTETLARRAIQAFPMLHNFRNFYGMTETCGLIANPGQDEIDFVDLGVPTPNVEIMILNKSNGQLMGPNEPGELLYRTPSIMRGYYKRPKETAEILLKDGWCSSGDMIYYDHNGRLHYLERLKDMIKCMDNQVVPAEVENLILSMCPAVAEVCVLGLPHPEYGEAAAAFVVLHEHHKGEVTEDDIKKIVADNLSKQKHLYGGVYFPPSLPRTDTGKVRKNEIRKNPAYFEAQA